MFITPVEATGALFRCFFCRYNTWRIVCSYRTLNCEQPRLLALSNVQVGILGFGLGQLKHAAPCKQAENRPTCHFNDQGVKIQDAEFWFR